MDILRKTFIVAATSCGAAWLLKVVAIAATAETDTDGWVVGLLWAIGMATFLLAAATGIALLLAGAPVWARVLVGVAAVPVFFTLLQLLDLALKAVYASDGWFRDELALVVAAVATGALGISRMRLSGSGHDRLAG